MKKFAIVFMALGFLSTSATSAMAQELWKGPPSDEEFSIGAMSGLAIINTTAGGALIGSASKKIIHQGFAPDLDNQVHAELQLGPVFISGETALFYSVHLRWNFQMDPKWEFYALGGLAGHVVDVGPDESQWGFHPRFGLGGLLSVSDQVDLRGEVSHELTMVGVQFSF